MGLVVEPWWSVVSGMAAVSTVPVLQVAADGRWEAAEVVSLTGDPEPARLVVDRVAQMSGDDLAVEILWPGQAFVGVRWSVDSWEQAVAAVSRAASTSSHTVETGLLALLGTTPGNALEFAELGAVNAWRSVGAERLWQSDAVFTAQDADSVLARRPDLATCSHPVAVELAVTNPQPWWIGVYVSTARGPVHNVDPQVLVNVLGLVC